MRKNVEVWVRLDLANPLHRRVLEILGDEDEVGGRAPEILRKSAPSPQQPSEATSTLVDSPPPSNPPPAAVGLGDLPPDRKLLRQKVFGTGVGRKFLLPVIAEMEPTVLYSLDDLAALTMGKYSRRQVHSLVSVAGKIEKDYGPIFARERSDDDGTLRLQVSAEIKNLLKRA